MPTIVPSQRGPESRFTIHAPNPSVNADAPVRVFNSASTCGGAPVTLIR
jgi:catechol 2,3-dioxygenase-like lactoylglutathione lyase family enzyme